MKNISRLTWEREDFKEIWWLCTLDHVLRGDVNEGVGVEQEAGGRGSVGGGGADHHAMAAILAERRTFSAHNAWKLN